MRLIYKDCECCNGRGEFLGYECKICRGQGQIAIKISEQEENQKPKIRVFKMSEILTY